MQRASDASGSCHRRFHDEVAERIDAAARPGSTTVVASGCSRMAGPSITRADRQFEPRPDRWSRASRRRTRPGAIRAPGLVQRRGGSRARTPRSRNAGRRPIAAARSETIRIGNARQQAAERRRDRRPRTRLRIMARLIPGSCRPDSDRQRHRDGVGLPDIVHVELVDDVDALDRNARRRDHRCAASPAATIRWSSAAASSPSSIRLRVCTWSCRRSAMHAAERRGDAGKARHQRALQPDLPDQRAGMQRAAAAERHGDELAPGRGRARSRPAGSRRPCAHRRRARSPPRHRSHRGRAARRHAWRSRACAASTSSDFELAADRALRH